MQLKALLRKLDVTKVVAAVAVAVVGFFLGRWYDRAKVSIEVSSIRCMAPEDEKVWLPAEPDLAVLQAELPTFYLLTKPHLMPSLLALGGVSGMPTVQRNPEVLADFTVQSPPRQTLQTRGPVALGVALPVPFQQCDLCQLWQLYEMANVPRDVIDKITESQPLIPGVDVDEVGKELRELAVAEMTDRVKKLPKAKERIVSLQEKLARESGVFYVDVVVSNSGGRTITLVRPITLKVRFDDAGDDTASMKLRTVEKDEALTIPPGESRIIHLRSCRADEKPSSDVNRETIQNRWNHIGKYSVQFSDSNGKFHASNERPFTES